MKKVTYMLMALAASLAAPAVSMAEEAETSASLDAAVLSAYAWRGQVLNDEAVLQPALTVSKGGFSIGWWGNMNLTDNVTGDEPEFSEHDIALSYGSTCPLTGADVSLGIVNYDFPNAISSSESVGSDAIVKDTVEAQLSYGFSEVLLAPTLFVAYDFKEADGFYGSLSIGHSFAIDDTVSIEAGASIGYASEDYNTYYFGVEDDAANDATFTLSAPIAVSDDLTVTPGVVYTMLVDNDIEDGADAIYFDKDQFIGSLAASYAF